MSLFDELERHGDQGWTYSHVYDRSTSGSNYNTAAVERWPGASTHSYLSGPVDNCVHEIKNSDTDSDEVLLVEDPGTLRVPGLSPQQNLQVSGLYQNVYSNHSPHSLPHSNYAQPHTPSRLVQPVQNQLPVHGSYYQQTPMAVSHKPHMQLPMNVMGDRGMHTHPQHSQLRSILLEQHQQPQQQQLKQQQAAVHMASNVRTDYHSLQQQQQNNRLDHLQAQREPQYMQGMYVDHTHHRQGSAGLPLQPQPQSLAGQVLRPQVNSPAGDYTHRQMEQNRPPPPLQHQTTYGKQQVVSLPSGMAPQSGPRGNMNQEKVQVRLPDSYSAHNHREQQQQQRLGSYPHQQQQPQPQQQQHNPHHPPSPSPAPARQTPSTPVTDSGGNACNANVPTPGPAALKDVVYRLESGESLKLHMVYNVKDPKTGNVRKMRWDGQKMVPADAPVPNAHGENRTGQPVSAADTIGGSQAGQARGNKGRDGHNGVTGVHQTSSSSNQRAEPSPPASQPQTTGTTVVPIQENCISTQGTAYCQQSKPVPRVSATNEIWPTPMPSRKPTNNEGEKEAPFSPENEPDFQASSESQSSIDSQVIEISPPQHNPHPPKTQAQTGASSQQPQTSTPQAQAPAPAPAPAQPQETNTERIKRKLKDDEEAYAVCRYCGYSSSNVDVCEGCSRKFPCDAKICIKKRRSVTDGGENSGRKTTIISSTSGSVDKKTFYGNKLKTQTSAFADKMDDFSEFGLRRKPQRGRRPGTGLSTRGRGRKNLIKEPVTVILSSDDEEAPRPDSTSRPSTNPANVSSTSQQEDDDMPFFPVVSSSNKPASFGTSRRQRMQDESGRCMKSKSIDDEMEVSIQAPRLVEVRGVRVGLMRCSGNSLDLLANSMHFSINSDRTGETFEFDVFVPEIECIKFTLSQMQPVWFLKVSPACGCRLRERLRLNLNTPEYFDPASTDLKKNMIVVILEAILNEDGLRKMFETYKRAHPTMPKYLQEINFDEANNLLVKSTPPVLTSAEINQSLQLFNKQRNSVSTPKSQTGSPSVISLPSSQCSGDQGDSSAMDESMDVGTPSQVGGDASATESPCPGNRDEQMPSRSPSPKIGFVGPVEKLLTYPPPPAKGGITITNEDLFCLNEGEFLNDVILDFYLKYLFREKLSEEDRQRTHIFSSFFYKRLMQRQSGTIHDADGVKLTPAQRRHSRVKTWTRHVDIFSKDFLFIPINEHSHWFLAVICFPGLGVPEYQGFEPAPPTGGESPNDSSAENGNSKQSSSSPPSTQDEAGEEMKEDPLDLDTSTCSKASDNTSGTGSGAILGKVIPGADPSTSDFSIGVKQPCILILDSLAGPSRSGVIKILKEYLQVEWDLKKKVPRVMTKIVRGGVPRVPQQNNYSDCGVFVLQYAESFFEDPICDFSIPMKGLNKWFPLSRVEKKREEIKNLILQLQAEAQAQTGTGTS